MNKILTEYVAVTGVCRANKFTHSSLSNRERAAAVIVAILF